MNKEKEELFVALVGINKKKVLEGVKAFLADILYDPHSSILADNTYEGLEKELGVQANEYDSPDNVVVCKLTIEVIKQGTLTQTVKWDKE